MVATIPESVDIAVVGGGPAGLALAAILERQGYSYVLFERSAKDTPPRGGCLDLHAGSGQLAMKEAGVYEEFQKYARGDDSTLHRVYDHQGNQVTAWGEGRDSPEIDRHEIKKSLLTGIPEEKIHWRKGLESSSRDENGNIVLHFTDGTQASGFKLVVGADGVASKVRPLVTPAQPTYTGKVIFSGKISPSNSFFPKLYKKVGDGPMVVLGRSTMIWCQPQGAGHYRVELGMQRREDFGKDGPVDLNDTEAVSKLMLSKDFFGEHDQFFKDLIAAAEGPFRDWPLMEMPVEELNWKPSEDVVLIGDAAHATTPFVGDGANCAMRDSVILVRKLKQFGFGKQAIAAFEKEMFGFARTMITNSRMSGGLMFEWDAPKNFMRVMEQTQFIGATDHV